MIVVRNLSKTYKVSSADNSSLISSLKSFISREYRYIKALDQIDWEVTQGDIHALIGRNGSGKSTLVKILSGVIYPTEGEALINHCNPWKDRIKYVRNIGVVLGHKTQLTWELPAIDTFILYKNLYSVKTCFFNENLKYLIKAFDAESIIRKPVRNLSLGERMKCEVICSLLHAPKVLFLDEPTIGLDLISKDQVRSAIKNINKELGTTIVLTSHDISDVLSLCNKISLIDKGRFLFKGSVNELLEVHASYKLISIELLKRVDECSLDGFSYIKTGDYSIQMELNENTNSIHKKLYQVIDELPISDITIESVKLEQVVKSYYEKA
ncbi:MAG: ATP-binding cassette domain-containing protein [Sporocytophaga sp.]|uniref:ABC transporter ATP-binding protein n=1 Tax=Sporocytophaga sp. TaxID=2231183 RepID=UPI001B2CE426|nr:ATP-binding cassette domain-containing protein [Sporocytophaga sp.]MBO9702730.1 ATP-binding cassette domain-containing protein [Sporocytophaga sp.]